MPLTMPRKSDVWDGVQSVVVFPAEDAGTQAPVICAMPAQVLASHFGGIVGDASNLVGAFRRYRPVIERAASRAYDRRDQPDFVALTEADFVKSTEDEERQRSAGD